jgi:hypothetical protein
VLQAQAQTAVAGFDPHYSGGRSSGRGHLYAAGFETRLGAQLVAGARFEIERSEDYAPNRALVYLRFAPATRSVVAFPPEPMLPTSEY